MAARTRYGSGVRVTPKLPHCGQLPVVLPPLTDELLSSWICRHAVFYGVPPVTMLRHCLSDASSMRAIDFRLTTKQAACIAHVSRTDATVVRQMSFANLSRSRIDGSLQSQCSSVRIARAKQIRMCDEVNFLDGASHARNAVRRSATMKGMRSRLLSTPIGPKHSMANV